ncbi:3,4-dihydroxyphenylacetate 2,3-dioxygenase [Saccharolobus shibatae]|nr:3,4-dihydroxyphenylacetate 2,3-dioxygenase [Saccharolobus shibatae]
MMASEQKINVSRLSHLCVRVTDLGKAKYLYNELLGFPITEESGNELYIRGIEEGQHHSLVLKKADSGGLSYVGFKVSDKSELDKAENILPSLGIKVFKFKEKGVNDAIIFDSPNGIPIVLYYDMEYVDQDLRLKFYLHKGVSPIRLAHTNFVVKDLEKEYKFFKEIFNFYETEQYFNSQGKLAMIWLSMRGASHEIAISSSDKKVPGFHHESFYVRDVNSVIKAADILASAQLWDLIENGPGRHGATQGLFLYMRDFDKNRFEVYTGDYTVLDPDKWKVITWTADQFRYRTNYWGRPVPDSWLNEWMPVEEINTGKLKKWD